MKFAFVIDDKVLQFLYHLTPSMAKISVTMFQRWNIGLSYYDYIITHRNAKNRQYEGLLSQNTKYFAPYQTSDCLLSQKIPLQPESLIHATLEYYGIVISSIFRLSGDSFSYSKWLAGFHWPDCSSAANAISRTSRFTFRKLGSWQNEVIRTDNLLVARGGCRQR